MPYLLEGRGRTFLLAYASVGLSPEVKQQIVDMAMNASGMRDTARVLHVRPTGHQRTQKKAPQLQQVNQTVLQHLHPEQVAVAMYRADELTQRRGLTSVLHQMWSYVGKKAEPRWLWHAIDHHSGTGLAYVLGRRTDEVFLQMTRTPRAIWYQTSLHRWVGRLRAPYRSPKQHTVGKAHTQRIESKHINLRTRLKR